MKNTTIIALLMTFLVLLGCGDLEDEADSFTLVSETPFSYNKKNYEYTVNIDSDGGEYVFSDPKHTIMLDIVYRNSTLYHGQGIDSFNNEYVSARIEDNVLTINITPNNTGEDVVYKFVLQGIKSYAELVFYQH
ncbi:MAG: hypothetical protein IKP73_08715 [Bacteroidales bacterium]|nr:hypothetical protein [Bacteroidales bacterium]